MGTVDDELHRLRSLLDGPASRARALAAFDALAEAYRQLSVPMIQGRCLRPSEAREFAESIEPLLRQAAESALRWDPLPVRRSLKALPTLAALGRPAPSRLLASRPTRPPTSFADVADPALRTVLQSLQKLSSRASSRSALNAPGDAGPLEALSVRHGVPLPADVRDLYLAVSVLQTSRIELVAADDVSLLPATGALPARWAVLRIDPEGEDLVLGCFLRDGLTHWCLEYEDQDFGAMRLLRAITVAEILDFAMSSEGRDGPSEAWASFFAGQEPRSLYVLEMPGQGPREAPVFLLHAGRREVMRDVLALVRVDASERQSLIEWFASSARAPLALHLIEGSRWRSVIDLRPLFTATVGDLPPVPLSGLVAQRKRSPAKFDALARQARRLSLEVSARALEAAIPELPGTRLERDRILQLVGKTAGLPRRLVLGLYDPDEGVWDRAFEGLARALSAP